MKRTENALLAREIDTKTIKKIIDAKETLSTLKQKTDRELATLGLNDRHINTLRKEPRPPIPQETVNKLLYKNRRVCCVCRDSEKSIIIHHIKPWEQSRDHSISNLAVLCLHHHDEAHSKKELSKNLDVKALQSAKKNWENDAQIKDAEKILQISSNTSYGRWDFINNKRLFELINLLSLDLTQMAYYPILRSGGIINEFGILNSPSSWECDEKTSFYMYDSGASMQVYFYMKEAVEALLRKLKINDITNCLSKTELGSAITVGDFISVQGAHNFKSLGNKKGYQGRNQNCRGYRKANGVEVNFVFDLWEATSSSSKIDRLSGRKSSTSISQVKDIKLTDNILTLNCSVLLIGSHFENMQTRTYGTIPAYGVLKAQNKTL